MVLEVNSLHRLGEKRPRVSKMLKMRTIVTEYQVSFQKEKLVCRVSPGKQVNV